MALTPGTRIGSYLVTAAIGQGGMGQVFRARDTKLNRDVALKVLPDSFAHDTERVARFTREAQTLAALNHPNIAAIYGLAEEGSLTALVMELVEGDDLAQRIARGAIPLDEVLPVARQIADALEAAHEQGIVHRDLKPANIKVRPDGTVKVLDFGLAKAMERGPATGDHGPGVADSPTITTPAMTQAGMILGTAAYMSPEQAKGRPADKRSDVWSFGCVLYEMLSGRRVFEAEDVSETLAMVLRGEPDWTALPAGLPGPVVKLLRGCLTRDRRQRIADFSTVRFVIDEPDGLAGATGASLHDRRRPLWQRPLLLAAAALVMAAVGAGIATLRPVPHMQRVARFQVLIPADETVRNTGSHAVAISPDGSHIVYAANQQLYLRSVAEMESRPIPGTAEGAEEPFFSPDGQWLGFYSSTQRKLKKIALAGGTALTICDADPPFGASWTGDRILFGQGLKGILTVSASGGKPDVLTSKAGEVAHGPQLLPGGEALLFTAATGRSAASWDSAQVVVQLAVSGERKVVVDGASDARYLASGHLVYVVGSTLLAVPFDPRTLQTTGGPVPVIDGVGRAPSGTTAATQFSVSSTGSLVYLPGTSDSDARGRTLTMVDRAGVRTPLELPAGPYSQPRISPDGRLLALHREDPQGRAIWIVDLVGATPIRRLTFGGNEERPTWTRDGQRVVFTSFGESGTELSSLRVDGSGSPDRLAAVEAGTDLQSESWSPDGKTLIVSVSREGNRSLARLDLGAGAPPMPLVPAFSSNSSLSPDGRWLAYIWLDDGRFQVFVEPFPQTGGRYQVSPDGGRDPLWSPDGSQLFFMQSKGLGWQLVSVDVRTQPGLTFGKPTPLPIEGVLAFGTRAYDITPDGRQFVVTLPPSDPNGLNAGRSQINVTLGWFEELRQRVPTK